MLSQTDLGAINVTAWLYRNPQGVYGVQVNPNVTIAQLKQSNSALHPREMQRRVSIQKQWLRNGFGRGAT